MTTTGHGALGAAAALPLENSTAAAAPSTPHRRRQGSATQHIVTAKPFLMLAGELHTSSASGVAYIKRLWPHLKELGLNTVLAPVSWELIEPREGDFDFTLVDTMVRQARRHDQRLVLLWFGSWKNGVSSYAPGWVLRDTARFPRAKGSSNQNTKNILSTLSTANREADALAFARLMRHLKQVDGKEHTVVMIQVQNEVGIKPEPRDLSPAADAAFAAPVPEPLLQYLTRRRDALHPELRRRWEQAGSKASGTWSEVFGSGPEAAEIFSAWHYARYIDRVAEAGKAEYDLPMYVNAWLAGPQLSSYPSGGPVAHMHDVWRAAAPHIDLLAPDIYASDFKGITAEYTRGGNPLFIPEASSDAAAAARVYWAIGAHNGMSFAPFGIESLPADHPLADSYALLRQLLPRIAEAQGTGRMIGIYRQTDEEAPSPVSIGSYQAHISYPERLPEGHPPVGGLILQENDDTFLVAGYGFEVRFSAATPGPRNTNILSVELGHFDDVGRWVHELRLNGDETGANYKARIPPFLPNRFLGVNRPMILRVRVYRHD